MKARRARPAQSSCATRTASSPTSTARSDRKALSTSLDPAKILVVIDDHHAYGTEFTNEDGANWRAFRVEFAVPASREWKVWTGRDRKPQDQLEFAELIEDNLPDIVTPDGSTMLSVTKLPSLLASK